MSLCRVGLVRVQCTTWMNGTTQFGPARSCFLKNAALADNEVLWKFGLCNSLLMYLAKNKRPGNVQIILGGVQLLQAVEWIRKWFTFLSCSVCNKTRRNCSASITINQSTIFWAMVQVPDVFTCSLIYLSSNENVFRDRLLWGYCYSWYLFNRCWNSQ